MQFKKKKNGQQLGSEKKNWGRAKKIGYLKYKNKMK